ncbi:type II toxin-antitoxin system VapC family toxin [Chamaesiphon sp. GL140_3_metabinner_50]|uniref:type II toxin-antitoxin system VapC family toxin n=1 Tax=Chamaesiphon sp. GL140_3_metabinner_50 TaxID=2970812 RepID=UPI0025FC1B02|nr:type II toxin-antitoxin system VapC family toxin [Chamaesiphon sp. GL140_3_metabinner_50]
MRVLIDTHVFIWYVQSSDRLPSFVTAIINDGRNDILLSIASVWEMAIKQSTGKLNLGNPYASFISEQMKLNSMELLPVRLEHLNLITTLPLHHRDPFDRLLIAQAIAEDILFISADSVFSLYPVRLMWE